MATFPNVSLILFILHLLISGEPTSAKWCIARNDASEDGLQKGLDYACSAGANCAAIQPSGPCFQPDTIKSHASYAYNSYYVHSDKSPAACDFTGTATFSYIDPSYGSCVYESSSMARGTRGKTSPTSATTTTSPLEDDNGMPHDASANIVTLAGMNEGGVGKTPSSDINDTPMNSQKMKP